MKVLIDTCVVVDVLQSREPFREEAEKLFIHAANERFTGCVTAKSVTDIYYLTHRVTHSDRTARVILGKLFSLFDVVDTSGNDCRLALSSQTADYEDAVMIETARRIGADAIVTRNERDFIGSPVPVYSPERLNSELESGE
ncbi:MAG: PIN domain-containing protein [Clostridia bacterium]|nr:PIN domain-containing protein [Clostridia bacterium]